MTLASLLKKGSLRGFATATPATVATHQGQKQATVARVAGVAVAKPSEAMREAFEERAAIMEYDGGLSRLAAEVFNADRWCWPHSSAMNSQEIDTFTARLARFTDKGVSHDDAERLADKLVLRDREDDDRRLCLECAHLQSAGRWRCGNWKQADVARDGLARDLVLMLQRCPGFTLALGK